MPQNDYEVMAKLAMLGEEVLRIALETGLVVKRRPPGRKPNSPAKVQQAKPAKPATKVAASKQTKPVEPDDDDRDPDDDND